MYLKNIEKIFRLIPTTLILILSLIAVGMTYIVLQSKKQSDLDLLKQKKVLENQFKKKELLNDFNIRVKEGIDHELTDIKKILQEHTYRLIGSLRHHLVKENPNTIINCLKEYEENNLVYIMVFEESKLDIIFGHDKIIYLTELIFGEYTNKYKEITLQYIASQGKHNLQEWRNDLAGTLKLSFFDRVTHNGQTYYVGTFSQLENIRNITKNMIINEIDQNNKDKNYYIWLYDKLTEDTYNFYNDHKYIPINVLLKTFTPKVQEEFLSDDNSNEQLKQLGNNFMLRDQKNKFVIAINSTSDFSLDPQEIDIKYKYIFMKYVLFIALISFLLIVILRHLSAFIKIQLNAQELQQKVEEELEKNRQKDRILIQQSKLAAMGEMLGNIAHQWRQPLNNVSLFLQFIQSNYKNEHVDRTMIEKYFQKSFTQINYMSQTIDDFRNFYKPSKQKSNFYVKEAIESAVEIIGVQLKEENIDLILQIEDMTLYSFENELKQSLLNILSNAHQAIKEKRQIKAFQPYIKVIVGKINNTITIEISNNGGSIKEDILPRIFEPYFTTKFESQGTGVGLYMTKSIVEVNLQGKIEVNNFSDGVSFKITLPLIKKE